MHEENDLSRDTDFGQKRARLIARMDWVNRDSSCITGDQVSMVSRTQLCVEDLYVSRAH